ncbi:MAG: hypothetical protein IJ644_05560 [Oscillospiraceae bacterium]|nr:hypothetical protein [Oscillospiraceae bacterium]
MKTYKQMADAVLSARDDYLRKKQRQKILVYRYAPVMASFSFAVLIGLHIWEDKQALPKIPDIPADSVIVSEIPETSETEIRSETETNPDNSENRISLEIPAESESILLTETVSAETLPSVMQTSAISETSSVAETHNEIKTEIIPEPSEPAPEIIPAEEIPVPETDTIVPETVITTEQVIEISTETEIQPATEQHPTEILAEETETEQETENTEIPCEDIPEEIEPIGTAKLFSRIVLHLTQSASGQNAVAEEDVPFNVTGYFVPEEAVGEWFDTVDVTVSYPDGTTRFIEGIGNAYLVQNFPFGTAAAVQFTGEDVWYLFRNSNISPEDFRNLLSDSGIM